LKDNTINASEAKQLLEQLFIEEYADSSDLSPSNSLAHQQLSVHGIVSQFFFERGRFTPAHDASLRAEELARKTGDSISLGDILSVKGCSEMRLADFDAAIRSFEECIDIAERLGDQSALSSAYSNLAGTYVAASSTENQYIDFAERCIQKAISIEEGMEKSPVLSIRYGVASEIYVKQGKFDDAIEMGKKAFAIDSVAGNTLRMARRLSQTGDALFAKRNMKEAERHYLRSMQLLEEVGDPISISINCKQLGVFYLTEGNRDKALSYWERGLALAQETGNNNLQLAILQKLYQFYRGHDDNQSIVWLERYTTLKDSLHNERNDELLSEYQERYKAAERELVIHQQQQKLRQRSNALVFAIIILVILGITTLLIHFLRKNKQKRLEAEKEVAELKTIISNQEKRIIDMLTHYVALHIDEKNLTNEDICNHLAVSQSTLNRQLSAIKGVSIQGFVQQMRMEKAERLLRTTKEPVGDIADHCGYEDVSYFTRVFKQCYGVPPTKYRSSNQKKE